MPDTPQIGEPAEAESDVPAAEPEVETYIESAVEAIQSRDLGKLQEWALDLLQSPGFWVDIGLLLGSIVAAKVIVRLFQRNKLPHVKSVLEKIPTRREVPVFRFGLLLTTWLAVIVAELLSLSCPLLRSYSLILTCYVFLKLPSQFIHWKSWMSLVSTGLFIAVSLHILGLLENTIGWLDRLAFDLGELHLSVLNLIQGTFVFLLLFWLAGFLSTKIGERLEKAGDLPPNINVLLSKTSRIALFVLAILVTMNVMGIKVTTLAVFGGALGLGLGFGLQKVVSNLVSGIILLLDKSIKPGDVIEIGPTYGWINSLNLRYVSVVTRDNKEHLIPNEDLITNPVVNWSFSSRLIRVKAPFGISYASDPRLAISLAVAAASETKRVLATPEPRCNLLEFGESSVNFELRFWIEDPHNGVGNIRSDVLLMIWDAFRENGIAFPFPQRDVHLRLAHGLSPRDFLDPADAVEAES